MAGALVDGLSTASATPAPNTIPKSDGAGKLDGWVTGGAPTATQTAARIPLYNAAKGLNVDGISFPATQVPSADANTLDDYEEGNFTPGIRIGGATTGITYDGENNIGQYTKVGRRVRCKMRLALTAKGLLTGNIELTGLPFTKSAALSNIALSFGWASNFTCTGIPILSVDASSTTGPIYALATTNGALTNLTHATLADNTVLRFDIEYSV